MQLGQERALGIEGLVAAPVVARDHRVDDHVVAVLVHPGGVAAEDHGQPLLGKTHSSQGPQIMMVERGGADLHGGPALGRVGIGTLVDAKS